MLMMVMWRAVHMMMVAGDGRRWWPGTVVVRRWCSRRRWRPEAATAGHAVRRPAAAVVLCLALSHLDLHEGRLGVVHGTGRLYTTANFCHGRFHLHHIVLHSSAITHGSALLRNDPWASCSHSRAKLSLCQIQIQIFTVIVAKKLKKSRATQWPTVQQKKTRQEMQCNALNAMKYSAKLTDTAAGIRLVYNDVSPSSAIWRWKWCGIPSTTHCRLKTMKLELSCETAMLTWLVSYFCITSIMVPNSCVELGRLYMNSAQTWPLVGVG